MRPPRSAARAIRPRGGPWRRLLALAPLLLPPAQEHDPRWNELFKSWGDEFREAKALRANPTTRAAGDERYRALTRRLSEVARELSVPLYYEAFRSGTEPELTPELETRLDWLELAASAAHLRGEEPAAARADQERAAELARAGRFDEALAVLAAARARTSDETLHAYLLQDQAELERRRGEPGRALVLLDELQALMQRAPSFPARAAVERIQCYVALELGLPDLAAEAIQRRLAEAEAGGAARGELDRAELAEARIAHANWLLAVGDLEGLAQVVGRYLAEEQPQLEPSAVRAELLLLLGVAEMGLEVEQPERAVGGESVGEEYVERAFELGLDPEREAFARLARAELRLCRQQPVEAAQELARARTLLESLPGGGERLLRTSSGIELVTLEARLAREQGAGPVELAACRQRLEAAIERMLAAWSLAPARTGGVGWLLYSKRRALLGEHAQLALALEGEERGAELALEMLSRVETLGTLARRAGVVSPTLAEIRAELLADGHGLLVFLPARGGTHVFALDHDGLVHATTAPSFEIEPARRAYFAHLVAGRSALADPRQRAWAVGLERRLAAELATLLFPPRIRARVSSWRALTIVGGDSLGPLPFEWLPWGDEPHLGTRMAVDHLPSMPLGVAWSRRRVSAAPVQDLLLVGGAPLSPAVRARWPELEPLELSDELTAELAAPFRPERVRVLRGSAATRPALLELDLGTVRVLQFLAHGVLERERERPLALVLAAQGEDPGLFRCEDAERGSAPRLVVLASCRTGHGPARKGDAAIADMGGAWLAAGAQAVVTAGAELTLAEARRVSSALHRRLLGGASTAEALRRVRAESVAELGAEAPFASGLLSVVGLGQRPVFDSAPEARRSVRALPLVLVGSVGLLAGLALGLWIRRRGVLRA